MGISENIKKLRDRYGLTQSELGEIAGVSDKAVSTWENGTAEPRMGAVQKIAEHFGITKGSIVDDPPEPPGPRADLSPDERLLVSLFSELNEEGQRVALDAVRGLVASGHFKKTSPAAGVDESA